MVLPRKAKSAGRGRRSGRFSSSEMSATAGSTARPGYSRRSRRGGLAQEGGAHVDRHVERSAVPAARIASRMIRLFSALPAPSSTSVRVPSVETRSGHPAVEDRAFGARRIVLGESRDLLEQLGAALVVEVLRRAAPSAAPTTRPRPRRASCGLARCGRTWARTAVRAEILEPEVVLVIARAPEAAEDLAANGVVPVAEAVADRTRPRGP